jgi:two-component system chemotaxis response regulator CheB
MGNDGSQACAELVAAGGQVIAQDEASSVVWGMPGAVATLGICSAVLPAPEIAPWVKRALKGGAA